MLRVCQEQILNMTLSNLVPSSSIKICPFQITKEKPWERKWTQSSWIFARSKQGEKLNSHFRVTFTSVSKRVLLHKLSYGNEFDLQEKLISKKLKGCAPRLVLKQSYKQLGNGLLLPIANQWEFILLWFSDFARVYPRFQWGDVWEWPISALPAVFETISKLLTEKKHANFPALKKKRCFGFYSISTQTETRTLALKKMLKGLNVDVLS